MQNQSENFSKVGEDVSQKMNNSVTDHSEKRNDSSDLKVNHEIKKSKVRIAVTYYATAFIFGGGPLLIIGLLIAEKYDDALRVFNTILPIAAGIVTYWFATRSNRGKNHNDDGS